MNESLGKAIRKCIAREGSFTPKLWAAIFLNIDSERLRKSEKLDSIISICIYSWPVRVWSVLLGEMKNIFQHPQTKQLLTQPLNHHLEEILKNIHYTVVNNGITSISNSEV